MLPKRFHEPMLDDGNVNDLKRSQLASSVYEGKQPKAPGLFADPNESVEVRVTSTAHVVAVVRYTWHDPYREGTDVRLHPFVKRRVIATEIATNERHYGELEHPAMSGIAVSNTVDGHIEYDEPVTQYDSAKRRRSWLD